MASHPVKHMSPWVQAEQPGRYVCTWPSHLKLTWPGSRQTGKAKTWQTQQFSYIILGPGRGTRHTQQMPGSYTDLPVRKVTRQQPHKPCQEIYIKIGEPASRKPHTATASQGHQETETLEPSCQEKKNVCSTRLPNHYKPVDNYRLGNINTAM